MSPGPAFRLTVASPHKIALSKSPPQRYTCGGFASLSNGMTTLPLPRPGKRIVDLLQSKVLLIYSDFQLLS